MRFEESIMKRNLAAQQSVARRTRAKDANRQERDVHTRILAAVSEVRILDPGESRAYIEQRQELGIDKYDEVWEGVYVVPPIATNPHQDLVLALAVIFHSVVMAEGRGRVLPGANVSDRRKGWEKNHRVPDVVVVLKDGRAIDCGTHWFMGPDFLVEIQCPKEKPPAKLPFYSKVQVRELLVIHPKTRRMELYRHDGQELRLVEPEDYRREKWLVSKVLPLAFRQRALKSGAFTE